MAKRFVVCSQCGEKFLKEVRHINENIKLKNNFYCSSKCFSLTKNKQQILNCENQNCDNSFNRPPGQLSSHNFCSRSCAAIYANTIKWGPPKPKVILTEEERKVLRKAASSLGGKHRMLNYKSKYTREYILQIIKDFVNKKNRLPVKKEMYIIYKQARVHFGTWNKAIEAAGFTPNPVMFAKHHIAKDGHVCDSLAEKIIDDWLFDKKIIHQRNIPYPEGRLTADFKIGDKMVEYFGLAGEHERYDQLKKLKLEIAEKYSLNLVTIYPENLYSKEGLEKILIF